MTLIEGCTPLHLAALRLCAEGIEENVRRGCDPNARDIMGRSPLCCALARVDTADGRQREAWAAAVLALLDGGADLDALRYVGDKTHRACMPKWLREFVERRAPAMNRRVRALGTEARAACFGGFQS
jgi:hypothetical protein